MDEVYSFGIIGENLLGFLEYYCIKEKDKIIKFSIFFKAFVSYGVCILVFL